MDTITEKSLFFECGTMEPMYSKTLQKLLIWLIVLLVIGFYLGWLDNGPRPLF